MVTATILMTRARVMTLNNKEAIDPLWILCDNESSFDSIKNPRMITNVRRARKPLELTGIGGKPMKIYQEGDLIGYGTAYFHPDVVANILFF
jgi:hypothetical protein